VPRRMVSTVRQIEGPFKDREQDLAKMLNHFDHDVDVTGCGIGASDRTARHGQCHRLATRTLSRPSGVESRLARRALLNLRTRLDSKRLFLETRLPGSMQKKIHLEVSCALQNREQ
jgi:hypothetical protein